MAESLAERYRPSAMSTIRVEADEAHDLARVYLWLSQHRGEVIDLDSTRRLALGVPISGARAVIVAVVLRDGKRSGPELGGVVRALSTSPQVAPVRLVFEGRSPSGLPSNEAVEIAAEMLHAISRQIAGIEPQANVA